MTTTAALAFGLVAMLSLAEQAAVTKIKASEPPRSLIFMAEGRPVLVNLNIFTETGSIEESWLRSIQSLHETLDRNNDGLLSPKEADSATILALIRLATGTPVLSPLAELDVQPHDDQVSLDELAQALKPLLGPFRIEVDKRVIGRTDALFDQLDRDKDGLLTNPELQIIAGTLRPLDLDDNDMISDNELEPFQNPLALVQSQQISDRQARLSQVPTVFESIAGESSLRSSRMLLKRYDKFGNGGAPRPDGKLSIEEFAIDPDLFSALDKNHDESLNVDELRKYLENAKADLQLDIKLEDRSATNNRTRERIISPSADLEKEAKLRQLGDGDVEFALSSVRLDIQIDDSPDLGTRIQNLLNQQFKLLDTNKDGYLEGKERDSLNEAGSPFAGLLALSDRDDDGKLYLKELLDFAKQQVEIAQGRVVVSVTDLGRAIFGILDLDRDRRLGVRELSKTVDRVKNWDRDHDNQVSADEIPYHFKTIVGRGRLLGLTGEASPATSIRASEVFNRVAADGPPWFPKMDRNRDGDISRREFLGPRLQFERLDRDKDGLIDSQEARLDTIPEAKK